MQSLESAPTSVVIAAYNEENLMARTLGRLPAKRVEPFVAVNGSTDRTADIARDFGASVIELDERGKLPAQQAAVQSLRDKGYRPEQPVIFMDADSYPAFPDAWAKIMNSHGRTSEKPRLVSGLTGFVDGNFVLDAWLTARRYLSALNVVVRHSGKLNTVFGINMAVTFGTENVREQFLDMPHIWPGEDRAVAQLVMDGGGQFSQSIDPRSLVLASARYNLSLAESLRRGGKYVADHHAKDYVSRRASATHRFNPEADPPLEEW